MTVYFKYPYILYEAMIPEFVYMYLMNPLDVQWYWNNINLIAAYGCILFIQCGFQEFGTGEVSIIDQDDFIC